MINALQRLLGLPWAQQIVEWGPTEIDLVERFSVLPPWIKIWIFEGRVCVNVIRNATQLVT